MVLTRSQTRQGILGQPPNIPTSPRVNRPLRRITTRQANADVADSNDVGGNQAPAARDGYVANASQTSDVTHLFKKCNSSRCLFCKVFNCSNTFESSITCRKYKSQTNGVICGCKTSNVVYLITCNGCNAQYVGETHQGIHHRFNEHRSKIKNKDKASNSTVLADHFNGKCKDKGYKVQIIEKLIGDGKLQNGKMDDQAAYRRRKREEFWMKELRTVYPYGLNNRCEKNMDQRTEDCVYKLFNKRKRNPQRRRHKKLGNPKIKAEDVIVNLGNGTSTIIQKISFLIKTIPQLNKFELQKVEERVENMELEDQVKCALDDVIKNKLAQTNETEPKKRKMGSPVVILYHNDAVDMVNVRRIVNDPNTDALLPNMTEDEKPNTVFKFTRTIRSEIFNYRQTIEEVDPGNWNDDDYTCQCNGSEFMDGHHKHVITGNLKIVQNRKLRKLLAKGPKFREKNSINFKIAKAEIEKGLNGYIENWSKKNRKSTKHLDEWKHHILEQVDLKIKKLQKRLKSWKQRKKTLQDKDVQEELTRLKKQYVLVPIDKAGNNIGFVCKKYYIRKILDEVKSDTYDEINGSKLEIIGKQKDRSRKLGIEIDKDNEKLPYIHATIKMHKNPVKFRYIIASRQCAAKGIAKKLTKILKLVMDINRNYCRKIKWYTGINRMWIATGTKDVLEEISHINKRKRASTVETFDFSTLYTKIGLEDLKEKLKWCIDKAFKGGMNQWIRVSKTAQFDAGKKRKDGELFSKEQVYEMVDFIIDMAFFCIGDKVYRQKIGIPMGTDPAPFMANLYLYYYEYHYMEKMTKEEYGAARKWYGHIRRFIDDLCGLNNHGQIGNNWKKIYPKELILNKENADDKEASFLDLFITVDNNTFNTKIYDKRDAFPFDIVSLPDLHGNITESSAYGVLKGQIIRYARNTSGFMDFTERIATIVKKIKEKGYTKSKIMNTLKACFSKYSWILRKYERTVNDVLKAVF